MPTPRRGRRPALRLLLASLLALTMVAAACSNSGDDSSSSEGASENGGGGAGAEDAVGEPEVGDGPHGTFEEISDVPGVTDDEIRIALLSTGPANPIGYCLLECQAAGIEAYFAWRNSQGGVHGRELVLDVIDDEFANNQARALEIIDGEEHFAVIGSPIMPTGFVDLADDGVPVYASAVQSDIADGVENMWTPTGTVCILCPAQRNVWPVLDAGATTVGVLGFGVAQASKDCVAGTEASFEKFGGPLGIEVGYANDDLPFGLPNGVGPEVSAMKRAGVDFIITCMDQNSVLTLARELDRQDMGDVPVSLPNAYGDEEYLTNNADVLEGDYIGLMYRPLEANQEGTDLEALVEWMGRNDSQINDWAIISWINADLLFKGILAAGPQFDRETVIETTNTFTAFTAGGLTPPVDWTLQHDGMAPDDLETNAPEIQCFAFVTVEGGEAVLAGDEDEPHFCWDPTADEYVDPTPTSFAR